MSHTESKRCYNHECQRHSKTRFERCTYKKCRFKNSKFKPTKRNKHWVEKCRPNFYIKGSVKTWDVVKTFY